jgi:hypothetical protein
MSQDESSKKRVYEDLKRYAKINSITEDQITTEALKLYLRIKEEEDYLLKKHPKREYRGRVVFDLISNKEEDQIFIW